MEKAADRPDRAPSSAEAGRTRDCILVALAFDRPSIVALRRGSAIAQQLDVPLHVVHVVDPDDRSRSEASLLRPARNVLEWADAAAAVRLPIDAITVRYGKPVGEIWREAARLNAGLLVLGGNLESEKSPGWLVRFLAQHARRPVLVAAPVHAPEIVAATDLCHPEFPVLQFAGAFAERTGASMKAVHNVRPGIQPDIDRLSMLGGDASATISSFDEMRFTHDVISTDAILHLARADDADVIAVGARETSGRTLRALVTQARRSVLAVPLARTTWRREG